MKIDYKQHKFYQGDCLDILKNFSNESIDIVITSPPYNIDVQYDSYIDRKPEGQYIDWCISWAKEINRVIKNDGSFFLNLAGKSSNIGLPHKICNAFLKIFALQNEIIWVKSIYVSDKTFGHFKPINSKKYLNNTHEFIFHFSKYGSNELNKLSIGVPYSDKSNIKRWSSKKDLKCGGNVWFMPYRTKRIKDGHPAKFPEELVTRCIKLHGYSSETKVLDIFAGSFTTALVCDKLNVSGVMIELSEKYFQQGIKKLYEQNNM